MNDRTFYLDKFETSTLEMLPGFDLTEEDTERLQNHYAKNIPLGKIKNLFEKRLFIKIDSTDFEGAVKRGPLRKIKIRSIEIRIERNVKIVFTAVHFEGYNKCCVTALDDEYT